MQDGVGACKCCCHFDLESFCIEVLSACDLAHGILAPACVSMCGIIVNTQA